MIKTMEEFKETFKDYNVIREQMKDLEEELKSYRNNASLLEKEMEEFVKEQGEELTEKSIAISSSDEEDAVIKTKEYVNLKDKEKTLKFLREKKLFNCIESKVVTNILIPEVKKSLKKNKITQEEFNEHYETKISERFSIENAKKRTAKQAAEIQKLQDKTGFNLGELDEFINMTCGFSILDGELTQLKANKIIKELKLMIGRSIGIFEFEKGESNE